MIPSLSIPGLQEIGQEFNSSVDLLQSSIARSYNTSTVYIHIIEEYVRASDPTAHCTACFG
jgi:hypothetical protein